jgi:DNA invertase Pin-like site-specific DNA recombinase
MFEQKYDRKLPYRYVCYGRMSSSRQNPRSPEQQFDTIAENIRRESYPWIFVDSFRDDAISGRFVYRRPGFKRLMSLIETGQIIVDLVVVDTMERLGRAREMAEIRRRWEEQHGILVVAADTGFSDPTGIVGQTVGMMEQMRSTEFTRISRHNVIRGKKDAARLRHWPGGAAPFGYSLKRIINEDINPPRVYSVLEPNPQQAAALQLAFHRAAEKGEGTQRLSRWWNSSPEIPKDFKPISPYTMGYRLDNPIAVGTLRWGEYRTAVISDSRVIQLNPDGAEFVRDFCAPIISLELYEQVQKLRRFRGEQVRIARTAKEKARKGFCKLIAPQARGLTLKYLLSGLIRCGSCNSSMRATSTGRPSKAGRQYVYYFCPRHYDGACPNNRKIREDHLREAVVGRLRARLFPLPEHAEHGPAWLADLTAQVNQELIRNRTDGPDLDTVDRNEMQKLEQQLKGWAFTLGNPELAAAVRKDIEANYAQAKHQCEEILQASAARAARQKHLAQVFGHQAVIAALQRLGDILAGHNPTLGNLELSKHIDVITCYQDGRVEMRGTMLGLFDGATDLLGRGDNKNEVPLPSSGCLSRIVPRRRGRLQLPNLTAERKGLNRDVDSALDPGRFAGLPESFFWTEPILIEKTLCWAEKHAAEVGRERAKGLTQERLAAQFNVTIPTIRHALKFAKKADESLNSLPRKMPPARWPEQHFQEVSDLHRQGLSMDELSAHFDRSKPLILAALRLAKEYSQGQKNEAV